MGSKSTGKRDFFGRSVKEKFPYYPYGVIIASCTTGPCRRHQPPSSGRTSAQKSTCLSSNTAKQNQNNVESERRQSPAPTTTTRNKLNIHCKTTVPSQRSVRPGKKHVSSEEACRRIAKIVARELPECCNKEFLQEIEQKCRHYWDNLSRHRIYLDDNEVCRELTLKLQAWAQRNGNYDDINSPISSSSSRECQTENGREEESRFEPSTNNDGYDDDLDDDGDDYSEQIKFIVRYGAPRDKLNS